MRYCLTAAFLLSGAFGAMAQATVPSPQKHPCDEDPNSLPCLLSQTTPGPPVLPDGTVDGIVLMPAPRQSGIVNDEAVPLLETPVLGDEPRSGVSEPRRAVTIDRQFQERVLQDH